MKATNGEFANRAVIFGCIIGVSFALYSLDPDNVTAVVAVWFAPKLSMNDDLLARILFAVAALILAAAALIRTWASAYLNAGVVYASEVKSASLVADGPYRYVRNPLYFANVLMAIAMGAMMSRTGLAVCVAAMIVFNYRLIFREEAELSASQGERYETYRRRVPRLWPSLKPRIASSARPPAWRAGLQAEAWYWGFAAALAGFAVTLKLAVFFIVTTVSIGAFWILSSMRRTEPRA
jgi:protein-S-isoprenylcysteine O-methyltransferase Ste14